MDVGVLRAIASSARVPVALQRLLWDSGDSAVRAAVLAQPDLDGGVFREFSASRRSDLVMAWCRVPARPGHEVDEVCSWAFGDAAAVCALAAMPDMSPGSLAQLVAACDAPGAQRLLARSDLSVEQRATLAGVYLRGGDVAYASSPGRHVLDMLGESPRVWEEVARACPLRQVGLLAAVPRAALDDAGVQEECLGFLERIPALAEDSRVGSPVHRLVKDLASSATLPQVSVERLSRAAARVAPSLLELIARRAELDVPLLLRTVPCSPSGTCPLGDRHVRALRELLSAVAFVSLPLEELFVSCLAHVDEFSQEDLLPLARQLGGLSASRVVSSLEGECGPVSPPVLTALMLLGARHFSDMEQPVPAISALAARSWEGLLRPHVLPEAAREHVVLSFVPVSRLFSEPDLMSVLCTLLTDLSPVELDTVLVLLGNWEGSLSDALAASRALACACSEGLLLSGGVPDCDCVLPSPTPSAGGLC